MNSRFSVFPEPSPVLSHITHRRGSDSSHKPTVSDLSLSPQHASAIEIGQEEEEEEGKSRRRKKKKKKKPLPSRDCLFFFSLSLRARVRAARVRPSSLPSESGLGCLIKKSSVSTVTKKQTNKQTNSKKKAKTKRERKRGKKFSKQTNKQGTANLYFKPAGTGHPCRPERGVSGPWWSSCRGDRQGDRGRETP